MKSKNLISLGVWENCQRRLFEKIYKERNSNNEGAY